MTTAHTLAALIEAHRVDVHDHLDRDEIVPVHAGLQFQGDIAVIPTTKEGPVGEVVPADGVPVVRGENGGNTHLLLPAPGVTWEANPTAGARDLTLGTLTVADSATAWLAHPEHGYLGVAPGRYEIRRQREQRDEIALVAD